MNEFIQSVLTKHISSSIKLIGTTSVSGGCINNAYKVLTDQGSFFLKWNNASLSEMFFSEAKGLTILHDLSTVSVPQPLGKGIFGSKSYLLTEWIAQGSQSAEFWKNFGVHLAEQHRKSHLKFGLDHDNFIGSLHQSNTQHANWVDFFMQERLLPQLKLASSNDLISDTIRHQFDNFFLRLHQLIPKEAPALLHGDLWSGNFMTGSSGEAVIFDPAVYYGHRETEIAFTQLFGGFSADFYHYYNEAFPLESGFDDRVNIHNLYPLLVHVNLFGTSYLSGIIQTLNRFA